MFHYQILVGAMHEKQLKVITINSSYQDQHAMENLDYLMDHFL